jgi:hypothetical protein
MNNILQMSPSDFFISTTETSIQGNRYSDIQAIQTAVTKQLCRIPEFRSGNALKTPQNSGSGALMPKEATSKESVAPQGKHTVLIFIGSVSELSVDRLYTALKITTLLTLRLIPLKQEDISESEGVILRI